MSEERFGGALARIRAQREEIRAKNTLTLRVPDYEDLQIRYRLMSEAETEKIGKRIEAARKSRSGRRNLDAAADFLISACDAVMVNEGEGFDVLIDDEDSPVKFDERLAEMLGFEVETARDVVLETFSPKGPDGLRRNPDAIIDHITAIVDWRAGREHEIDRELLGE